MSTWKLDTPTPRDLIAKLPEELRNIKNYLQNAIGRSHYFSGDPEKDGKHKPGCFPVVDFCNRKEEYTPKKGPYLLFEFSSQYLYLVDENSQLKLVHDYCAFPSGCRTIFFQDTAPPGWFTITSYDEACVYITNNVTVKGGRTIGNWLGGGWFTVSHSHTYNIPGHVHEIPIYRSGDNIYFAAPFGTFSHIADMRIGVRIEEGDFPWEEEEEIPQLYPDNSVVPFSLSSYSVFSSTYSTSSEGVRVVSANISRPSGYLCILCEKE